MGTPFRTPGFSPGQHLLANPLLQQCMSGMRATPPRSASPRPGLGVPQLRMVAQGPCLSSSGPTSEPCPAGPLPAPGWNLPKSLLPASC